MTSARDEHRSVTGWLRELRRAAAWHRRLLVAGLLAASVAFAMQALTPAPPAGVAALVATKNISGGVPLSAADVQVRDLPATAVPDGALRHEGDVTGRTLTAPLRSGEVITDVRVVGPSYLEAYGDELVAAPVRVADAAAVRLLRPGDVIDVLAAGAQAAGAEGAAGAGARLAASGVQVITIPRSDGSLLGSGDVGEGALIVVATTSATAARLASAAVTDRLSVVIRPG